jgi:hypothetical protein
MKKIFNFMLAMLAVCGVACTPNNGNGNGNGDTALSFVISVTNITSNGAVVSVTPSTDATYYFDVVEKDLLDGYYSEEQFLSDYVADIKAYIDEENAAGANLFLGNFVSSGNDSYTYGEEPALEADTEYYAFAFGLSESGEITSGLTKKPFKTLEAVKGDKAFDNLSYGSYTNYGDYYGVGATNWYIDIYPEEGMDFLVLEVQTPLDATDFTGDYPFASTFETGTAVAGFVDEVGYPCGSHWGTLDNNYNISNYALCKTGNVAISKSGEDYTVVVDAVDADGYKVTANYTGVIEEFIPSDSELLSVKKHAARRFRFVPKKSSEKSVAPLKLATKRVLLSKKIEKIASNR